MNGRVTQQGLALVMVLWVVMLLSIMAGSFVYTTRTETTLIAHSVDRARALAAAEAGMIYALYRQLQPIPEQPWPADGRIRQWRLGDAEVAITLRDASGRLDINHADRELFRGLLTSAGGLDESEAETLLDRIEDFRDPDDLRRPRGAERSDYEAVGRPAPKNAAFESVDELQQVLGMEAQVYERIADVLTVHSYQAGINPEAASAKVLYALPGIDPATVEDFLRQRELSREQEQPVPPLPGAEAFRAGPSGVYHVGARVRTDGGAAVEVEAVLAGQGPRGRSAGFSAWREDLQQRDATNEMADSE